MRDIGEAAVTEITPHVIRDLPDTPPVDVTLEAGLLARGSLHSLLPSQRLWPQWHRLNECSPLTVAGAAPALLSSMDIAHRIPVLASDLRQKNLEHNI